MSKPSGYDPYNSASALHMDVLEWEELPRKEVVQVEYNDEYWINVWGMKIDRRKEARDEQDVIATCDRS